VVTRGEPAVREGPPRGARWELGRAPGSWNWLRGGRDEWYKIEMVELRYNEEVEFRNFDFWGTWR
jgi:hypothetical protein